MRGKLAINVSVISLFVLGLIPCSVVAGQGAPPSLQEQLQA